MLREKYITNTSACAAMRREEHRGAAHAAQEERHQEEAQHHAVEDRADDVDRLDQVLRQSGEEGEADRDDAPQRR